jgi:hypothetical protein
VQISVSATVQTSGSISRGEMQLVAGLVGDTLREAVAVATEAARNQRPAEGPEKEIPMSESSGPSRTEVDANAVDDRPAVKASREHIKASQFARQEPVDANRGTRIPAADQRDAKNEKPA